MKVCTYIERNHTKVWGRFYFITMKRHLVLLRFLLFLALKLTSIYIIQQIKF